jgi:tungstate transport system substrate-binding protein
MRRLQACAPAAVAAVALAACSSHAQEGSAGPQGNLVLATTTSTQDSGLLDVLVPAFEARSACELKTVAVGSGQAMAMGERGDADALLVHSPAAEERFMAEGHGSSRDAVMHNDFVLVGPPGGAADVAGAASAAAALEAIAEERAAFVSRGDDSGTHAKELELWKEAAVDPAASSYVETGQGMGATLTIAEQKDAYTLSDRSTFLANRRLDSEIVFEGTSDLRNDYHVVVVDHAGTNVRCAEQFSRWLVSAPVQETIGKFGVEEYGQALFFPDAAAE